MTLDTRNTGGRFGNKVFQNAVVSAVARRFDLRATYAMRDECEALGMELFSGSRDPSSTSVRLTDALAEAILSDTYDGERTFVITYWTFFQTPALARWMREKALLVPRCLVSSAPNTTVFVHVRLGDIHADTPSRPTDDWVAAVDEARRRGGTDVLVASDEPSHEIVSALVARTGATPVLLDAVGTIRRGASCAHLVLSDGSFSWLVAALAPRPASVQYLPRHGRQWHGDIFVFDDWVRK